MRKLFILLFLLPCFISNAQQNPRQLYFNYLGVENGLPEPTAWSMLQDRQGYIWIGTQNGLVRYDGYTTRVYNSFGKYGQFVPAIYEDKSGQLWVAVDFAGLFYYNRANDQFIKLVPVANDNDGFLQPDYENMNVMLDDGKGNLWLAEINDKNQPGIVYRINLKTKKYTRYSAFEKSNHFIKVTYFTSFIRNIKGNLWFGSSNGLYEYNYKQDRFTGYFNTKDSARQQQINYLVQDPSQPSSIWLYSSNYKTGKPNGVSRFNTTTGILETFKHDSKNLSSIADDSILNIQEDSLHHIWFCTGKGLSMYDAAHNNFINYTQPGNSPAIISFKENRNHNFWCRTNAGLLFFNTKTNVFTRFTSSAEEGSLKNNIIDNILLDKTGTLWINPHYNGVQWVNERRSAFIYYHQKAAGTSHNFKGGAVYAFAGAPDSTIWMACQHGFYRWKPLTDSFELAPFEKVIKDAVIGRIMIAADGTVWFAFYSNHGSAAGLYTYNPKTKKLKNYHYNAKDTTSISNNAIISIVQDSTGTIWIGTLGGGMCRYNKQADNFTRYPFVIGDNVHKPSINALDDDEAGVIYPGKKGILWIGTNNGALNQLNSQTGKFISYLYDLPGFVCVTSIHEDAGKLWAGTYMNGLFSLDKQTGTLKKFTEKDGLLYNGIYGILEDKKDNLWLNGARGISVFNTQNHSVRTITKENGLPAYLSRPVSTFYKTHSNLFLYGCDKGFVAFNPGDLAPDTTLPVMHIESIAFMQPKQKTDSSIIRFGKEKINLHYNENRITFNYVGLMYQNTGFIKYAYKLDGYDKDWVQAGTQRTVTYTNLSPGTYTFHVKAANADGIWSTKDDSITIVISPPWWQTWWAYLLYAIIAVIAVSGFVAYRSRALKQHNKILEHKVQLRTAEVLEQKEELTAQKEELAAQRDHLEEALENLQSTQAQLIQSEKMASLGELTAGIAHEIQNPLNFVNNFSEVNKEMIAEMKEEIDNGNYEEVKLIANNIEDNEEKISHHGKRADAIVKNMLQHSRQTKGVKEPTDINALCDEYLRLSYHGLRAKDKSFNADFKTDFDESIGKINIVPQDIGRVLLNLFNNAFYAVNEQKSKNLISYEPTVSVSTKKIDNTVEIKVKDNGNGVPQNVIDKIFQPFFTTKPTGSGTGLGLSLSYDIIKAHGGEIKAESKEGEGTMFTITLIIC